MSSYLTEDELSLYTASPISMLDAENATLLIDAYKGMSFYSKKHSERVKLSKKHGDYGDFYKGRVKHKPRISVLSVTGMTMLPFGQETANYGVDSVVFDDEESPYFTFMPRSNPWFSAPLPTAITVEYTSGYEVIPEQIKRATAQLAANLKASGGGLKWASREDFDLKITLTKDGIFTNEIKRMVDLVELS